jgi:hypothetical protein
MKLFYLIRNISDCTYWSCRLTKHDLNFVHQQSHYKEAVLKHGPIYVNRKGGWFPESCVEETIRTEMAADFPEDPQ